jgi:hypothetical protein
MEERSPFGVANQFQSKKRSPFGVAQSILIRKQSPFWGVQFPIIEKIAISDISQEIRLKIENLI